MLENQINENFVGRRCIIEGEVRDIAKKSTRIPAIEAIFPGEFYYLPIYIKEVTCQKKKVKTRFSALLYINKEILERINLSPSYIVLFKARIQKPIDEEEGWKFQFKRFLYANGYMLSLVINKQKQIKSIRVNRKFNTYRFYGKVYEFIESHTRAYKEYANFMLAILFGATHRLSDEQKNIYINSGTFHFFAVSGFSVMVLYAFVSGILNLFLIEIIEKNLISIGIVWLYIFLCGFVPSALRAGIIITLFLLSNIFYRKENFPHFLLLSFIIILILDHPYAIFDVSFQYSFIIYSALLFILPCTTTLTYTQFFYRFLGDEKLIMRVLAYIFSTFISITILTLVSSFSIQPLAIKYFGLGKVWFFDNILANCVGSIFFSVYFIVSLIFVLLIFIFGGLPPLCWSVFKGVNLLEKILSLFTKNTIYFGTPYDISIYLFYLILISIALLITCKKINIFKTVTLFLLLHFSFTFFSSYPERFTSYFLYSTTCNNNTIYYYIKDKKNIIVIPTLKFNKQIFYHTISFLRYIRFLEGNVIFLIDGQPLSEKVLTFKNFFIRFQNTDTYQNPDLHIRKVKVTKKLYNTIITAGKKSILFLQSVNKKWLINFLNKNRVDVIELANNAKKPATQDILCTTPNLLINRSTKFTILCNAIPVVKTSKTVPINTFVKQ